jgi:hypothetical protein
MKLVNKKFYLTGMLLLAGLSAGILRKFPRPISRSWKKLSKPSSRQAKPGRRGGSRNLDAVRESVNKNVDMKAWREKFVGQNKEDWDFSIARCRLITSVYAEMWRR